MDQLSDQELRRLLERVFSPQPHERQLAIAVDLPDDQLGDNPAWRARRLIAADWVERVDRLTGWRATLVCYANAGQNNGSLPETCVVFDPREGALAARMPQTATQLADLVQQPIDLLYRTPLIMAMTELSATAPLKLAARSFGLRAATMSGFGVEMLPALRLDYEVVARRVDQLKGLLDRASRAEFAFRVGETTQLLTLDLRHRTAHASSGLLRQVGTAGNLPSGEAYIVPYEGEREGDASASAGTLPVQFDQEVVVYRIVANRAVEVLGAGPHAASERELLAAEPAYGNIAELGLGVLADLGIEAIGELLLDEKLGLHIAFGRSDHFGGQVGVKDFFDPRRVVHIDRVYIPQTQPLVQVVAVDLLLEQRAQPVPLIRDSEYVIDWA
ncbi:MAG: hypothetical protein H6707_12985 [Deltaproteobacteria bacterium]|nr:hypothetical protein [Deltaproteobacteria bacterium]